MNLEEKKQQLLDCLKKADITASSQIKYGADDILDSILETFSPIENCIQILKKKGYNIDYDEINYADDKLREVMQDAKKEMFRAIRIYYDTIETELEYLSKD